MDFFATVWPEEYVPEEVVRFYARQLVDAFQQAHSEGLYHPGLTPKKLLLDDSKNLKIADFGVDHTHHHEDGLTFLPPEFHLGIDSA